MPIGILPKLKRIVVRTLVAFVGVTLIVVALAVWTWHTRPEISDAGLHPRVAVSTGPAAVTATWFGVSTILFDDGDTQLLVDGFISRPSFFDSLLGVPVSSDAPMINYVLNEYGMRRLAAIIPAHSHHDHAMDIGAIANRSSASIIGSETTANIARGAGVPEDQIIVAEPGNAYEFGEFTVTLVSSLHAPVGLRGAVPLPGTVDEPFATPASIRAWRMGGAFSLVISHSLGTTIVQGSAGFVAGALDNVTADVVMLGVGMLEGLGRDYAEDYWQSLVTATGATTVFPIHFEDFTRPFGEIVLMPAILDNFVNTATWLREFRDTWDGDTQIFLPVFGEPVVLYPVAEPEV